MWRVCLLLLLLSTPCAHAEDAQGPRCELLAFVDEGDAGMRKIYDGLRKGLELAQLPRVCQEPLPTTDEERAALHTRLRGQSALPVFAVGDDAVRLLSGPMPNITRVFALERYTVRGRPLLDLPVFDRLAIVYAARPAERIGEVLRGLTGRKQVRAWLAPHAEKAVRVAQRQFGEAAGLTWVEKAVSAERPDLVLHLRLAGRPAAEPFAAALATARRLQVPLVCDDRGRFGQGAVVTLVGRHDLLGKAAAECGRRLRKDPRVRIPPYGLPGVAVWVDLGAADAQDLPVPLPFLARADRLEAGRKAPR